MRESGTKARKETPLKDRGVAKHFPSCDGVSLDFECSLAGQSNDIVRKVRRSSIFTFRRMGFRGTESPPQHFFNRSGAEKVRIITVERSKIIKFCASTAAKDQRSKSTPF